MTIYRALVDQIAAELTQALAAVSADQVELLVQSIGQAQRLYVAGAGRSGWIMRACAVRLTHLGLPTHVVGDATTPAIGGGDLLMIGSGSGETASLLSHATRARRYGARMALITAYPASSIGQQADVVVHIPAPTPKAAPTTGTAISLQPMANLFEQSLLIVLDVVTMRLAEEMGTDPQRMFARHANLE